MGQRELDTFNANAADFMRRFGDAAGCQCAQCVKTRREGVIEGLELALEIAKDETWGNHPTLDRIRAEIERLKA